MDRMGDGPLAHETQTRGEREGNVPVKRWSAALRQSAGIRGGRRAEKPLAGGQLAQAARRFKGFGAISRV